jgi:shikimate dehydrogenase
LSKKNKPWLIFLLTGIFPQNSEIPSEVKTMNISSHTKIIGLFGDPVIHSLSPAMHNAAFSYQKLPYTYIPFHVTPQNLPTAISAIRALNLTGVNITVPHKEKVIPHLNHLDESAVRCGAVNTILNVNNELIGHNTDGPGFIDSLNEVNLNPRGIKAIILGAGGSARAIAAQLAHENAAEIIILNRTLEKAQQISSLLPKVTVFSLQDDYKTAITGANLVINTLSVPFKKEGEWLVDLSSTTGALFYDLRYGNMPSDFLHYAKELNNPGLDGLSMLLHQGARAFTIFTNQKPALDIMRKALVINQPPI